MTLAPLARTVSLFVLFAVSVSGAQGQQARGDAGFEWSKRLAAGSTIAIRNIGGTIRVSESSSDRVEVRAVKLRRSSTARDVAFDVVETNGRTTICTLSDRQTSCRDQGGSSRGSYVRVEFTVLVPRDVRVDVGTGTGDIQVDRAGQAVSAATGNGRVFVATARGPVNVSTGSGDVDVRVESLAAGADVEVVSGSGLIRVALPADFGGALDAQSGNGMLHSDFDVTILGRMEPGRIRGTIGRGSSRIKLLTGNGRIEVRKY